MPRVCGERKHITKNLFHKSQQQLAVLSASTSLHQSSISPSSPSIQQQLNTLTIYRSNGSGNNTNTNHCELSSCTISGNSYTNSNSNGNSIQPFQNQQQQENNQRNQPHLQPQNSPLFQNQQNANEGVVQIPKPETSETVSVGTTSNVSGNIRYHGKPNVADSNPIGVRCGRREWNAAQSLVKLNAEQIRTTTTTTNITATPPTEMATLSSSMPSSSATQSATTTATKSTSSGPVSPTEGSVAPLYYSNAMDIKTDPSIRRSNMSNINTNSNTSLNGKPESNSKHNAISKMASTPESKTYLRTIKSEGTQEHVIFYAPPATSANGTEKPYKQESSQYTHISSLYRERSIEETEAAHDLLSLSQSLPPLPAPCVVTIHQQEESSNYTISNSPVMQEISNSSNCIGNNHNERVSIRIEQDNTKSLPSNHQHQNHNQPNRYNSYESSTENCSPLTPPTSEHSSDIEVDTSATDANKRINKLPHDDLWNPELSKVKKEKIFIIDGRSKNRKPDAKKPSKSRKGSYKCSECGRAYATSSNLSRHKQTHRSLDSQSAKKCHTCGKAYVSMPALAMHLLTHKLTHSCGICGKLFSRPWLLQGHLRSHTGEKPYVCAHCGKAFADRSNLRAHMQTHSSSKKYKCPRCLKTFALKSYLNKHLESACYNDKDFLVSSDDNDEEDIIVT